MTAARTAARRLTPAEGPRLSHSPELAEVPPVEGPRVAVHLIAHGSPDPRHSASVRATAGRLERSAGVTATTSFLEHDHPRAEAALAPPASLRETTAVQTTVVVPLLLTAGVHWHRDVPPVIAPTGARSVLLAPPAPADFAEAVVASARPATAGRIVLATAWSARPQGHRRMADLAGRVYRLMPTVEVVVAARPDVVASVARPGDVVVPVLIAEGIFADRICAAAAQRAAAVTRVIGETDAFAHRLGELALAAAAPGLRQPPPPQQPEPSSPTVPAAVLPKGSPVRPKRRVRQPAS